MEFTGSDAYYLNPELGMIVSMAMQMDKPLLLTGEPGTGKTQLAFEISRSLQMPLEVLRAKSTIKGEEACYVQDTVLRLNDARFGTENTTRNINEFFDYIVWGPIGRAFRSEERVVLLLDEIDKTESDVQDNLLDVLDEKQFTIREVNQVIQARHNPLIIITSNAKRELSDPFLRRCFCHHLAFPSREEMIQIVRLHYPDLEATWLDTALNLFYELRARGFEKAPATSELLDWIQAVRHTQSDISVPDKIPFIGALLKRTEDILAYRKGPQRPQGKQRGW